MTTLIVLNPYRMSLRFVKIILPPLFVLSQSAVHGQLGNYKTSYAEKVKIRLHNTTIGYIAIIPGLNPSLCLKTVARKKDSTGSYVTEFKFYNPGRVPTYDLTIVLQFDKLVDTVYYSTDQVTYGVRTTFAKNNLGASFQASHLAVDAVITGTVISKRPVITSISGISSDLTHVEY